ncbi:MAG: hypothetical protein ACLT4C_09040 [Butyricicoccus sp.]
MTKKMPKLDGWSGVGARQRRRGYSQHNQRDDNVFWVTGYG